MIWWFFLNVLSLQQAVGICRGDMSFGNMSAGPWSRGSQYVGGPRMFYSVCGSREMGALGGTGGEHLDCCHLLLVSISTHCLVLDSDLAWKWDLEGGQCWWQGQGCRRAWHKVGDIVCCERRQERWFEWEDQELCFSFVEYEQGDDYLKEDVWETGWNCSLARSRLI